jgi:hypothetical protein
MFVHLLAHIVDSLLFYKNDLINIGIVACDKSSFNVTIILDLLVMLYVSK